MKAQELLNKWGERKLEYFGIDYDEGSVNVTEETFSDGFCDTCYYEYTAIAITYTVGGRFRQEEVSGYITDVIDEAMEGAE